MIAPRRLLPHGVLAGAEHRHNANPESGRIIEADCDAHGLRKLGDAENVQPVAAKEGDDFITAIYRTEEQAQRRGLRAGAAQWSFRRQYRDTHNLGAAELTPAAYARAAPAKN